MLKLIQKIMGHAIGSASIPSERKSRRHRQYEAQVHRADPLSHPVLRTMDQRQLGDLPFDPRCFDSGS
jgi:hypothetical protein